MVIILKIYRDSQTGQKMILGLLGLDVNTPKEVDGKLAPSGQRAAIPIFLLFGVLMAMHQPTRRLTEYS